MSPIISLMDDQMSILKNIGIDAICLKSEGADIKTFFVYHGTRLLLNSIFIVCI